MARSGASTVAELAAAGKPALLVPFAAAADEHQHRNAEAMVEAGAAVMLEEKDLEIPGHLLEALTGLLNDPARMAAMGAAARTQAHPDAAERIADQLAELAGKIASQRVTLPEAFHRPRHPVEDRRFRCVRWPKRER